MLNGCFSKHRARDKLTRAELIFHYLLHELHTHRRPRCQPGRLAAWLGWLRCQGELSGQARRLLGCHRRLPVISCSRRACSVTNTVGLETRRDTHGVGGIVEVPQQTNSASPIAMPNARLGHDPCGSSFLLLHMPTAALNTPTRRARTSPFLGPPS